MSTEQELLDKLTKSINECNYQETVKYIAKIRKIGLQINLDIDQNYDDKNNQSNQKNTFIEESKKNLDLITQKENMLKQDSKDINFVTYDMEYENINEEIKDKKKQQLLELYPNLDKDLPSTFTELLKQNISIDECEKKKEEIQQQLKDKREQDLLQIYPNLNIELPDIFEKFQDLTITIDECKKEFNQIKIQKQIDKRKQDLLEFYPNLDKEIPSTFKELLDLNISIDKCKSQLEQTKNEQKEKRKQDLLNIYPNLNEELPDVFTKFLDLNISIDDCRSQLGQIKNQNLIDQRKQYLLSIYFNLDQELPGAFQYLQDLNITISQCQIVLQQIKDFKNILTQYQSLFQEPVQYLKEYYQNGIFNNQTKINVEKEIEIFKFEQQLKFTHPELYEQSQLLSIKQYIVSILNYTLYTKLKQIINNNKKEISNYTEEILQCLKQEMNIQQFEELFVKSQEQLEEELKSKFPLLFEDQNSNQNIIDLIIKNTDKQEQYKQLQEIIIKNDQQISDYNNEIMSQLEENFDLEEFESEFC